MMPRATHFLVLALLFVLMHGVAEAHKPSDSYLKIDVDGAQISGQWDIALRDLDFAIGLDSNQDKAITWGEVKSKHEEIAAYALSRLTLGPAEAPCVPMLGGQLIDNHSDGAYAVLRFIATCPVELANLDVSYRLFLDIDPQHRGLLNLNSKGRTQAGIFSADTSAQRYPLSAPDSSARSVAAEKASFVVHGFHHILIGYDHILFVLTLLIGTAMQQRGQSLRRTFLETAKVVTAFTLSHSVTLGLAALGILVIPVAVAESLIAATIAIAALNNIWPVLTARLWLVALGFGLIHGVGFANVLSDLGLPQDNLLLTLLAFNIGVEAGQLVIVAVALPLIAYAARLAISRAAMPAANCAITALALLWLSDRALGTALMPF